MRFPAFSRAILAAAFVLLPACASLPQAAKDAMAAPDITGTSWGLMVMTMDGREVVSIRPDERFLPASNTKLFTVAAAFHRLGDVSQPDPSMGAWLRLQPREGGSPDLALVGGGDPWLIDSEQCERDCLDDLVAMAKAGGVTRVHGLFVDTQLYPDERWAPGWAVEDIVVRDGAPVSAIVVNSNQIRLEVSPGDGPGDQVKADWGDRDELMELLNEAFTVEGDEDHLRVERGMETNQVRLYGTLSVKRPSQGIPLAVYDPARAALSRFARLLVQAGIEIETEMSVTATRSLVVNDEPDLRDAPRAEPAHGGPYPGTEIARLTPPPVIEQLSFLAKQSQNLHAEMFLRRLGLLEGQGSRGDGLAIVEAMLAETGADRREWDLHDGSGMSVYNRVTPRMMTRFLLWTARQPWAEAFKSVLPVGGVDGTLSRRFRGTPLEGRIFAKTGTLSGTNALAGFMLGKSGKMLAFAIYANDRPQSAPNATVAMDAALNAIAAAH